MEEKLKIAILGKNYDKEYGKRIIDYLMSLGVANTCNFDGVGESYWCPTEHPCNSPWIGAYGKPLPGHRVITLDEIGSVVIESTVMNDSLLLLV